MTPNQLLSIYWETFRQEARDKLSKIQVGAAIKTGTRMKEQIEQLEIQAFPFDPEADGDFDKGDLGALKALLGGKSEMKDGE